MTNERKDQNKVCIIITAHRAQPFLGYCLNSVLSQTYQNWTAVIVNDGNSAENEAICRRYENLDSRFYVCSESGVDIGCARNLGLSQAEGDYLMFLEGKDCLALDAMEKQVTFAQSSNCPLIIGNVTDLDFGKPEGKKVGHDSNWLGQSSCVLNKEEFALKRMGLIRHTGLLEDVCGKLYDLVLWKRLKLQFSEEQRLDRGFAVNMEYCNACKKLGFLNDCCYYRNQGVGFEETFGSKIKQIEQLEAMMGGRQSLSEEERDAFYCYVAGKGLSSVKKTVLTADQKEQERLDAVRQMLSHPLLAESLSQARDVPEEYAEYLEFIRKGALQEMISYITTAAAEPAAETSAQDTQRKSVVNRLVCWMLRLITALLGKSSFAEKFARLERMVAENGLKYTIAWILPSSANTNDTPCEPEVKKTTVPGTGVDHSWIDECGYQRYVYQKEINELRQRKKAIIVGTAEHSNIGDCAITLAEKQYLSQYFPEYFQVEISTYEYSRKEAYLHAILHPEDILFIHGGGNLGDRYMVEEDLHRKVISEFPNHKIVIFTQTVSFSDTEQGRLELQKSARVYNAHPDLTLFARGEISYQMAKTHFDRVNTVLMTDMVHILRTDYGFERSGVLLCMRDDVEVKLNQSQRDRIKQAAHSVFDTVHYSTNMYCEDVPRENCGFVVRKELMRFASHKVIITDRLHGMIFSAITGTPCIVFLSSDHKIVDYYQTFFKDSNAIFFAGESLDQLEETIRKAASVSESSYPILDQKPYEQIRNIVMTQ